jgi:hypothetical protein
VDVSNSRHQIQDDERYRELKEMDEDKSRKLGLGNSFKVRLQLKI